jgi:hypothetical protein
MWWARLILAIVTLALAALQTGPATAAPKANLWPRWEAHADKVLMRVDHEPWQTFLQRYVTTADNGINLVKYADVTAEDKFALNQYIRYLTALNVDWMTRDQQLAYWVNLYNAFTVKLVLDHYPVSSIRKIRPSAAASGPWRTKLLTVNKEDLSLDDIEHRILRPIWRDPRIHYVLNCAALGCPNLLLSAMRADKVNLMLEAAAHGFINHPRGVSQGDVGFVVSSIYNWYEADFGGNKDAVLAHILRYARPALARAIHDIPRIEGYAYDWRLNDAALLTSSTP